MQLKEGIMKKRHNGDCSSEILRYVENCLMSGKNSIDLSAAQHSKHDPNRSIWDEYISVASVDFLLYMFLSIPDVHVHK